jgi:hypothetical protein
MKTARSGASVTLDVTLERCRLVTLDNRFSPEKSGFSQLKVTKWRK